MVPFFTKKAMNFLEAKMNTEVRLEKVPNGFTLKSRSESNDIRQLWCIWLFIALVIFMVQSLTADVLPDIRQDEAQITDYGRLVLHPTSKWSVNWLLEERKPLILWSYLGPLISEAGYQIVGYYGVGPRIVALLGGLVAATMIFGWLLARSVPLYAAFFLSLAFLLDPLFVLAQRMARVDAWVMALCLGCCWILRTTTWRKNNFFQVASAGGLAVTAMFIWPSAFFLYPLIIMELAQLIRFRKAHNNLLNETLKVSVCFIAGGACFLFLLLIPVWSSLFIISEDISKMVSLNTKSSLPLQERLLGLFNHNHWFKLVKAMVKTFSPVIPLCALISLFYRQKIELLLVTLFAMALIFATLVYEFRVLYLLPYFFAMTGTIFQRINERQLSPLKVRFGVGGLCALVLWSVGVSLFARTYFAMAEDKQQRSNLYKAVSSSIGSGKHKVFLGFTYELYYSGRSLGWELYTPYLIYSYDEKGNWIRKNDYLPEQEFRELLSKMDFAIFPQGAVSTDLASNLMQSGLRYRSVISVNSPHTMADVSKVQNRYLTILTMFLRGKKDYGPYLLYERQELSATKN